MPEPLWKIRQRKGMTVSQLAARSGVPAISITEYESGHAVRSADLPKLAKALFVEEWDIEIQSPPRQQAEPATAAAAHPSAPPRGKPAESPTSKARRPQPAARPSQIEHLLNLTTPHFDKDRATLEQELGKPLEDLTQREASQLLNDYQRQLVELRPARLAETSRAKRRRAYLPEGVDEFELNYLTSLQDSSALIHFTLFDGQQLGGKIIGFSPYSITVSEEMTGEAVTLQKLAIAYYRTADTPIAGTWEHSADQPVGGEE